MIAYILKSSLSLLLLFGLYWFLLRKEKLFVFNRYFLLFSILLSLVLPFISIPLNIQTNEAQENIITLLNGNLPPLNTDQNPTLDISKQQYTETDSLAEALPTKVSFSQILLILYIIGLILSLFRFTKNILNIFRQIQFSEKTNFSGKTLVLLDDQINPYCFFNTIFVCKQDYRNNKIAKEFLTHELEHIRQSHSTDILLLELIRFVYWFNPILLLYSNAIRVNHEYLADSGVIRDSSDIDIYLDKLLSLISNRETIPLTSGLNHSLMKRRLLMITKPQSKSSNYILRITLTLCMILVFFLFLSFTPSNTQPITSLTNHKDAIDTLLINKDSLKTHRGMLNLTSQSSNVIDKEVTYTASGYIKQDTIYKRGTLNLTRQSFNVIDKEVTYTASGYIKQDTINKIVVLIGGAIVNFGETTIKADSIVFNMKTNQLFATGRKDSSGEIAGNPIMEERSVEFEADEITYNLESHRAQAKNIKTKVKVSKDNSAIIKPLTHNQLENVNADTSTLIPKSVIQQDNNSDDWWKPIVKKHGINYESSTVHNYYVVLGKKVINGDIESFNDVVAISKSNEIVEGYIIYKTKTASFDSKKNELTINDCTMDVFGWNSKITEPVRSYTHIIIVANFTNNFTLMADVPQKTPSNK